MDRAARVAAWLKFACSASPSAGRLVQCLPMRTWAVCAGWHGCAERALLAAHHNQDRMEKKEQTVATLRAEIQELERKIALEIGAIAAEKANVSDYQGKIAKNEDEIVGYAAKVADCEAPIATEVAKAAEQRDATKIKQCTDSIAFCQAFITDRLASSVVWRDCITGCQVSIQRREISTALLQNQLEGAVRSMMASLAVGPPGAAMFPESVPPLDLVVSVDELASSWKPPVLLETAALPPAVEALRAFCQTPIPIPGGVQGAGMWTAADDAAFCVPVDTLRTQIATVRLLVPRMSNWREGGATEHLTDIFILGPIVATPWDQVFHHLCPKVRINADKKTKSVGGQRIPLVSPSLHGPVLYCCRPNLIAYECTGALPVLLCHAENKVAVAAKPAAETAAFQCCLLEALGLTTPVAAFVTMEHACVSLYGLTRVADQLCCYRIGSWDLCSEAGALDCLASMFRLAEWLAQAHLLHEESVQWRLAALKEPVKQLPRVERQECRQVEAELATLFVGVAVDRTHSAREFAVKPPWHYRVGPSGWLKVVSASHAATAEHEADVMKSLREAGVECVPQLHRLIHFGNGCVGLLMSCCGQPLRAVADEEQLLGFATQAAAALAEVHAAGWVHGDVKESNLCVDAAHKVWMLDWEFAERLGGPVPRGYTRGYRAPETVGKGAQYSDRSDMYSFGVMLGRLRSTLACSSTLPWDALLESLMQREPDARRTAREALGILRHKRPAQARCTWCSARAMCKVVFHPDRLLRARVGLCGL